MLILGNSFQGLEDLFNGIASLLMLLFFLALLVAIVFGGVISTLVGSVIGSALHRTLAEQEFVQQTDHAKTPQSVYQQEDHPQELKRPLLRGIGFQILFTLFGAGTLYIIFLVFAERRFEQTEAWCCLLTSLVSASAIYKLRQTKRNQSLPEDLAKQGKVRLYLTWFYLTLFANVVIAGIFSIWALTVNAFISIGMLVYPNQKNAENDEPSAHTNTPDQT